MELATTFSEWVHRRVETIEFPNADVVRRRMSVDFSLPPSDLFAPGETVYVPVMILKKLSLRNFDLRDASGASMQMLTTAENREVAVHGLSAWLWPGAKGDRGELVDALSASVGEPDFARAQASTAHQLDSGLLKRTLDNLPAAAGTVATFRALVEELALGFLLLVPMKYEREARTVVKFSYDASRREDRHPDRDSDRAVIEKVFGPRPDRGAVEWYRVGKRLLSQLGLAARLEDIEDIQLGWSGSYHVELVPPGDMRAAEAALEPQGAKPLRDDNRFRPHLHIGGQRGDSVGQVSLSLHAQRNALVLPLAFSAGVIAVLLAMIPHRLAHVEFQALAALLVLPFALAAYYVRSGEHSYVTAALRLLRIAAIVPVVAGLLVLAMLGLGYLDVASGGQPIDAGAVEVAEWPARVAAVAATFLLAACVAPSVGGVGRRVARATEDLMEGRAESLQRAVGSLIALLGAAAWIAAFAASFWILFCVLGI